MTTPPAIVDQASRDLIERTGLDRTLFVEAGAGTGKTRALVRRVTSLVTHEGVPLRSIAAITFTEAAGAELRDRIRQRFEELLDEYPPGPLRDACEAALADSDAAAIGTLHSFALRILSEHPLEAGLPPRVEILDEVSSQLAFEDRWQVFLDDLHADPRAEALILSASVLRVPIEAGPNSASLKDVAAIFGDNWDRLDPDEPDPGPLPPIDWAPLRQALDDLVALLPECHDTDDLLYARIVDRIVPQVHHLLEHPDPYRRLDLLTRHEDTWTPGGVGRQTCWTDAAAAKAACRAVNDAAGAIRRAAVDAVLDRLRARLARFTRAEASRRQHDGRLEFHDLLVLSRELVRTSAAARASLHARYQRLLLDEFQDTDPIQIEIAARIAGAVAGADPEDWVDVPVDSGRLFFVGDPKQSIYRFRRADISMFLRTRAAFADDESVPLVQNFRTVEPILAWVNHVFQALMPDEIPDKQPRYRALVAHRTEVTADHRVVLLGGGHEGLKAPQLREVEADDVARAIASVRDHPERWPVHDTTTGGWRDPVLSDVTVLLPTRTALRQLEDALDAAAIPYRVDTGTLVYDTQEVRDVLAALRAVDDATDAVALVTALRSPLYGCSDHDLFTYHQAGGRWSLRAEVPDGLDDHPVVRALGHLRSLWEVRWWLEPSELMGRLLRERHAFELGLGHRRPREVWRRLRFLVDQAHLFEEAGGGGLRAFLAWAGLQSHEGSRVHEPLLPETDDIAVSIKTVHGAKGLEFPITVVSGLTTLAGRGRPGVSVVWEGNRPGIKFRKGVATDNFDRQADFEAEMDQYERQRLLYVACTRARDHLVVSTHHNVKASCHGATLAAHSADVEDELCRRLPDEPDASDASDASDEPNASLADDRSGVGASAVEPPRVAPPLPFDDRAQWIARREALLEPQRVGRFVSATTVARQALERAADRTVTGAHPDAERDPGTPPHDLDRALDDTARVPDDADLGRDEDADADDSGRPAFSRRRGRAGTAIGRAVHATLQLVDLATGEHLDQIAAQQAHAEAVPDLAGTVAGMARSGLASHSVQQALAGGRLWRELYVAAPLGERAVEGYIDLLYQSDEGLVIVDYKTDAVGSDAEIDAKLHQYRLQLATYAEALEASTGLPVAAGRLVFCRAGGAIERDVDDLAGARAEVRALLGAA